MSRASARRWFSASGPALQLTAQATDERDERARCGSGVPDVADRTCLNQDLRVGSCVGGANPAKRPCWLPTFSDGVAFGGHDALHDAVAILLNVQLLAVDEQNGRHRGMVAA